MVDLIITSFLIFFARVADVTFGTLRTITIIKNEKIKAFLLSIVEVIIWITASAQVLNNSDNLAYIFAYSLGYATGVYVGMLLESKLSTTERIIQLFTYNAPETAKTFANVNYKIYQIAQVADELEKMTIFYLKTERKNIDRTIKLFKIIDPKGYYVVHEARLNQRKKHNWFSSFLKRK